MCHPKSLHLLAHLNTKPGPKCSVSPLSSVDPRRRCFFCFCFSVSYKNKIKYAPEDIIKYATDYRHDLPTDRSTAVLAIALPRTILRMGGVTYPSFRHHKHKFQEWLHLRGQSCGGERFLQSLLRAGIEPATFCV
jgi:hypothetical protein